MRSVYRLVAYYVLPNTNGAHVLWSEASNLCSYYHIKNYSSTCICTHYTTVNSINSINYRYSFKYLVLVLLTCLRQIAGADYPCLRAVCSYAVMYCAVLRVLCCLIPCTCAFLFEMIVPALVFASAAAFYPSITTPRCAGLGFNAGGAGVASARKRIGSLTATPPGRPEVSCALHFHSL